ncbi:MAG: ferritin family protein [Deltaproteobacteria bacterium]|nr:ferritin family protein [Deltaproteobacteria bacterium]
MNFNSVEEIVEYALDKEKEAVEFYTELSQNETFKAAKETFLQFAEEEKKHVRLLENFGNDKVKIGEYKFEWIPDMKRSDYMVDVEYEPGMHYTDILRLAMKREEKSLKLYNELSEKADSDDFVNMFKMLCQEEAKHKQILETIYDDFMAEQGD